MVSSLRLLEPLFKTSPFFPFLQIPGGHVRCELVDNVELEFGHSNVHPRPPPAARRGLLLSSSPAKAASAVAPMKTSTPNEAAQSLRARTRTRFNFPNGAAAAAAAAKRGDLVRRLEIDASVL